MFPLAQPGESCDLHCGGLGSSGISGKVCDAPYMHHYNHEVDTQAEMNAIMTDLGFPCSSYAAPSVNTKAPFYTESSKQCTPSSPTRALSTVSCSALPASGERRLCFCFIKNCVHLQVGDFPMQACRWHPERKRACR